jgi:hypothetical protein
VKKGGERAQLLKPLSPEPEGPDSLCFIAIRVFYCFSIMGNVARSLSLSAIFRAAGRPSGLRNTSDSFNSKESTFFRKFGIEQVSMLRIETYRPTSQGRRSYADNFDHHKG